MSDKNDDCEFCRNPGEYHHRLVTLEGDLTELEKKMEHEIQLLTVRFDQEIHTLTIKVDKFMFLLFGTFTASVTAALGAVLTIVLLL